MDETTRDLKWSHQMLTISLWAILVPLILGGILAVVAGVWAFFAFS